ncbi:MAG: hypothetical protein NXY57DRAFT_887907 [Lentinula lateritia]|uniref:TM7S3/TM198-like domain-containing protein n=1 Tax=Lentinula lateritia TaxID=40482 RepID=A0ABQ8VT22_9AGAR|nr:MAG: hypothetical protein NXY57DRAFT_887907 [Lentinula lateritia]KAJ4499521.1 hypothetical protein C8R41DRAFT_876096 [Lentinula lateritia]
MRLRTLLGFLSFPVLLSVVAAQSTSSSSNSSNSASSTSSASVSLSLTTATTTETTAVSSNNQISSFTTVVTTVFNVSVTATPTSASSTVSASASASATADPTVLQTRLDPAFGVLGAILILTGLPSAFWGHKNRWTSFFLIGFYTLSLVCFVLILKFGILPAVNPPSKTLRGMFVLACSVAGIAGGACAIFFWKAARYGIGAWGGFALALWIQCFRDGGVIRSEGLRWIMYIGCAVVGFVLCTIPKIHYHVLLVSTSFVGASAFILGVDCFTTAGLKEFYVWNVGFQTLFTRFTSQGIEFPVTQTMQIELGLIGAVALMGIAVQLRILKVLQRKLHEISQEQKKRDEEAELAVAGGFAHVMREREEWEKEHLNKHGRQESGYSSMPLMKDQDGSSSPGLTAEHRSDYTHVAADGRPRYNSGVSEFLAAPTPNDELKRATSRGLQSPGVLPALDLGLGIKDDVPDGFIAKDELSRKITVADREAEQKRLELMEEINTIRRSIDVLKNGSPEPSSASAAGSRRPSLTSRRTLSMDANSALLPTPSHVRPPREKDPRSRVHSMDLISHTSIGESLGRPTSAPLRDNDWDAYIQDRKLLQPPAGVSPPIATTPMTSSHTRIHMPHAVSEALQQRKRRESALGLTGEYSSKNNSSEDIPLTHLDHHRTTSSNIPVTILPPQKPIIAPTPQRPVASRTRTFEELNERHREKMKVIQSPLTNAENEHAQIQVAKERWERSKALEKEAVTRRLVEKAAIYDKRKKSEDDAERTGRRSMTLDDKKRRSHSRSLSADRLAALGTSSKRLSTMKVEDWQKYQHDSDHSPVSPSRRDSRGFVSDSVPFPERNTKTRRKSREPPS